MTVEILAAVFAFLAAGTQLVRLVRMRPDDQARHQRTRAAAACGVLLIGGLTGSIAAYLGAHEQTDDTDVDDYGACIEDLERQNGEPSGGVSDIARAYCNEHRRCDHLNGTRDLPDRLVSPERWCEAIEGF